MGYIIWILFITIFFGANEPSSAFLTFLGIFTVVSFILLIIVVWKEDENKK